MSFFFTAFSLAVDYQCSSIKSEYSSTCCGASNLDVTKLTLPGYSFNASAPIDNTDTGPNMCSVVHVESYFKRKPVIDCATWGGMMDMIHPSQSEMDAGNSTARCETCSAHADTADALMCFVNEASKYQWGKEYSDNPQVSGQLFYQLANVHDSNGVLQTDMCNCVDAFPNTEKYINFGGDRALLGVFDIIGGQVMNVDFRNDPFLADMEGFKAANFVEAGGGTNLSPTLYAASIKGNFHPRYRYTHTKGCEHLKGDHTSPIAAGVGFFNIGTNSWQEMPNFQIDPCNGGDCNPSHDVFTAHINI